MTMHYNMSLCTYHMWKYCAASIQIRFIVFAQCRYLCIVNTNRVLNQMVDSFVHFVESVKPSNISHIIISKGRKLRLQLCDK